MSQLDDAILDSLTHVTFPQGFAQAECRLSTLAS